MICWHNISLYRTLSAVYFQLLATSAINRHLRSATSVSFVINVVVVVVILFAVLPQNTYLCTAINFYSPSLFTLLFLLQCVAAQKLTIQKQQKQAPFVRKRY